MDAAGEDVLSSAKSLCANFCKLVDIKLISNYLDYLY